MTDPAIGQMIDWEETVRPVVSQTVGDVDFRTGHRFVSCNRPSKKLIVSVISRLPPHPGSRLPGDYGGPEKTA
jgi:hypothetical protein